MIEALSLIFNLHQQSSIFSVLTPRNAHQTVQPEDWRSKIPTEDLPGLLALNGSIVTIDAAGCRKKVVAKIVSKGADDMIGLKGNQPTMLEEMSFLFSDALLHLVAPGWQWGAEPAPGKTRPHPLRH